MTELETLHLNRITLNSGYIFLDDLSKAKRMKKAFDNSNIKYSSYVTKNGDKKYYGFKVFRIKKQLLEVCSLIKEAII